MYKVSFSGTSFAIEVLVKGIFAAKQLDTLRRVGAASSYQDYFGELKKLCIRN